MKERMGKKWTATKFVQRLQSLRERAKSEAGVTLIELLAVIVILAVIAAVAVPTVVGQIEKSKENTDKQNAKIIVDAINRAILDAENAGDTGISLAPVTGGDLKTVTMTSQTGSLTTGVSVESILVTGSGTVGPYLSDWPAPQSTSSPWTVAQVTTTTNLNGAPTFTVGNSQYYITP